MFAPDSRFLQRETHNMEIVTIVTSVVTSTVIAAGISGIFMVMNGHLERKSRKKENFLKYAVELAKEKNELVFKCAQDAGQSALFRDSIFNVDEYYKLLISLDKDGKLPEYIFEEEDKSRKKL